MKVSIISIGNEIMNGFTTDTNSSWISRKISKYESCEVTAMLVAKDQKDDIISNLDYVIATHPDYIFITGGLGPTHDDITKKVLASYFKSKIVLNEPYYIKLRQYFKDKKIRNKINLKTQAQILDISKPIPNRCGTALGMAIKHKNINIFIMPGVPREMQEMMKNEIIPLFIDPLYKKIDNYITILTTGIYESNLYDILKDIVNKYSDKFMVSFLPSYTGVKIRLFKSDPTADLIKFKSLIVSKIDRYVYGFDNDTIEGIVSEKLLNQGLTLAVAESCTGGYLSKKLTDRSGSSKYFKGSIVAYNNNIKNLFLGVTNDLLIKKGAVSSEVALEMAKNIMYKFDTDIGVSTTGISGPTGGTDDKPIGLIYIAVVIKDQKIVKEFNLVPSRREHREVATHTALNMLRLLLK